MLLFSLVGFKRIFSLLGICLFFARGLKQMEDKGVFLEDTPVEVALREIKRKLSILGSLHTQI